MKPVLSAGVLGLTAADIILLESHSAIDCKRRFFCGQVISQDKIKRACSVSFLAS